MTQLTPPRVAAPNDVAMRLVAAIEAQYRGMLAAFSTTPGMLRLFIAGNWVLCMLLTCAVWIAVDRHHGEMQAVGKDSAPSIIAAQGIKWDLADMHGNLIRGFLGTPEQASGSVDVYRSRRSDLTNSLLVAAENITYGDTERTPIRNLMNGLGRYDEAVAQSRILHSRNDAGFLSSVREADAILHKELLPAADQIRKANQDAMENAYTQQTAAATYSSAFVVACLLLLLTGLGLTQLMLQRRMHRRINPALLAATLLMIVWTAGVLFMLRAETSELRSAKEDAFDSIIALWRARAECFDAQAQQSLSLLDPASAAGAQAAFSRETDNLATIPSYTTFLSLQTALENGRQFPVGFQGFIADEFHNITFNGEREAAMLMLRQFIGYVELSAKVRESEKAGNHAQAVQYCVADDQCPSSLKGFNDALDQTLQIDQNEFNDAVDRGLADTGTSVTACTIVAMLMTALLAHFGLRQRLKEYDIVA